MLSVILLVYWHDETPKCDVDMHTQKGGETHSRNGDSDEIINPTRAPRWGISLIAYYYEKVLRLQSLMNSIVTETYNKTKG